MKPDSKKIIAIDVTHINASHRTGIGRVVEDFLRSIIWSIQNDKWPFAPPILISAKPWNLPHDIKSGLDTTQVNLVHLPFGSMYAYRLLRLAPWAIRNKPDLLFIPEPIFPGFFLPTKYAVMHYDLIIRDYPKTASRHIWFLYKLFLFPTLRSANFCGVDSQYVREKTSQLIKGFNKKSEVLPIYIHSENQKKTEKPEGINDRQPFGLFVGNLMPHKNVRRLIRAFARWHQEDPDNAFPLYIVGRLRPEIDDMSSLIKKMEEKSIVHHFGYVSDENLEWLYSNAKFFALPSIVEGFGLPVLEAMSRGCPVITSEKIATEEAAGNAAILINPKSESSILKAIKKLGNNEALRHELREKGLKHAKEWTVEKHANALIDFFNHSMNQK